MHFGIHTGRQHCTCDEMRRPWKLRDPIDLEGLQLFMEEVVPAFRG